MSIDWVSRAHGVSPRIRNLIDGRLQSGSGPGVVNKFSPRDGRPFYSFEPADSHDVDRAVASAARAFQDGRWCRLPIQQRKAVLQKLATLIEARREHLALFECLDVGKPITDALTFDVPAAASIIRFNAEVADKLAGKVYGADQTSLSYQLRRPIGVVAGIVGWNFPLVLAVGKLGPVLASGSSLVLKPSELSALSAACLAELALEAGVPEGVFNVVHGGPEVGRALAEHHGVHLLTFTGSSQTGKRLLISAGQSNMKRLILECGGKSPNIVFSDCPNLESVADAVVARAFWNQGQVCTASSRLLVQDSIKREFLDLVIDRVAMLTPRDPLNPDTRFGAVISREHRQKLFAYVQSGSDEGARRAYESDTISPNEGGYYVSPVIFDEVSPRQRIAQEEIFGPVLSVMSFQDEENAIRLANATIYGLSAILWTRDLGRAHRVTQGIEAGWIVVNATGTPTGGPGENVMGIGGHKDSGIGLEGGIEGVEAYTSSTAVQIFV